MTRNHYPARPISWCVLVCTLCCPAVARAETPMVKRQVPGYYRTMLGKYEVTTLFDGRCIFEVDLFRDISTAEVQALLAREGLDGPHQMLVSINAFLINTGANLILIDAGGGKLPDCLTGSLPENLKASGYSPEQVDIVLLTHLHPDHVAGLVGPDGKPLFTKAKVYVAKAEHDYWLSSADPEPVPSAFTEYLRTTRKLLQGVAAPYIASNQWNTFENADLPVAEAKAIPTPGHTPGHMAYEVASDGRSLIVFGDVMHCKPVQFARPDATVVFDCDPKQAFASREMLFRRIVDGNQKGTARPLVAGAHLPFPGIGRLFADGPTALLWAPMDYSPIP